MIIPDLSLDFTSASLDSRITFTRTTDATHPATYVNSSGYVTASTNNAPRFDYDPVTLTCRGLLIEESRTNLLTYSDDFSNPAWTSVGGVVSVNQVNAPNNSTDADLITEDASTGRHFVGRTSTVSVTGAVSVSCFVKKKDRRYIQLCVPTAASDSFSAIFDLDSVSVTDNRTSNSTYVQTYTGATIIATGNGWYRLTLSGTTTASAAFFNIGQSNTGSFTGATISFNMISYTGDNASGTYVWGAQIEAGAFATSYIPTTTATLTRNADVAVMTGTNFSDWWQAGKGGVLVRARPGTISGTRPWVQFDDGTANEIIALRGNTTNPELYIVDGGVAQAQIDAGTIAANTDYSLTGWWATNDCKARLDSGAVVTDTSATIPTVTQARLGSDGTNYLNGHLASIIYYDRFSSQIYTRRKNKAVFSLL